MPLCGVPHKGTLPSVGKGGFGEVEILWPLSGGELEGSYFGCRPEAAGGNAASIADIQPEPSSIPVESANDSSHATSHRVA